MNGIKKARTKRCKQCQFVKWTGVGFEGPHSYRRHCTATSGDDQELHDNYMEGPDSNCPEGFWSELDPIGPTDPQEWENWNQQRTRDRKRKRHKPGLKDRVQQIENNANIAADAETALAVGVALGYMPGWLADEIRNEL